jgi:hypothetical protein
MPIAGGVALCGAVIAAAAGLIVVPRSMSESATDVPAHAAPQAASRSGRLAATLHANKATPWIEVPAETAPALPSAVPANALPVARTAPRRLTASPPVRSSPALAGPTSAPAQVSSTPTESDSASALPQRVPSTPPVHRPPSAPAPVDPVLKAVQDEVRAQESQAPTP